MALVQLYDLGKFGILRDTDMKVQDMPPEAWSDGLNVRFQDNSIRRFRGEESTLGTPSVAPYFALWVPGVTNYWLYAGLAKVYATATGAVHDEITRAVGGDYSASARLNWNGGILGGVAVLNNGVDVPQYWTGTDPTTDLLADLTAWPAGYKAKVLRPFSYFLVALNITDNSGVVHPHRYKWSSAADPGTIPATWDKADPTQLAGENDLTDVASGAILDAMALREMLIVYKENATHGLQFVGGDNVFKSVPLLEQSGILTTDCVVSLPKGKGHFVATGEDVIIFNGQTATSLIDKRWRRWLTKNIDASAFDLSFCAYNPLEREMWFCFPESGHATPNKALVISEDGTVTLREIPALSYITTASLTSADLTDPWSGDTGEWELDSTTWAEQPFAPYARKLVGCAPGSTQLLQMDMTNQFQGVNFRAFVERTGLAVVGRDRNNEWKSDFSTRKLVRRIWPQITGAPVQVYVGAQENPDEPITWSSAKTFTPGVDKYIDPEPTPNGRMLAVRFESTDDAYWEISGYNLEIELLGEQ